MVGKFHPFPDSPERRYPLEERYPIPPQHRFCSVCGSKMVKMPDGNGVKCSRCNNIIKVMID
jgi:hypothetical protein